MIKKMKKLFVVLVLTFTPLSATFAQMSLVNGIYFRINNNEITDGKEEIDKASVHEETKDNVMMWFYRARIYQIIALSNDENIKKLDSNAAYVSLVSYINYFNSTQKKKKSDIQFAQANLIYVSFEVYKSAIYLIQDNKDYNLAVTKLNKLKEIFPFDIDKTLETNNITINKINYLIFQAYLQSGNNAETINSINVLIQGNYQDPAIYIELANIYAKEKNYDKALETLELAKTNMPQNVKDFIVEEINIYIEKGEIDALKTKMTAAIALEPENDQYYYIRGVIYHQQDSFDKAEADYIKCLELNPSKTDAHYNLGVLYIDMAAPLVKKANSVIGDEVFYERLNAQISDLYKKALPHLESAINTGGYNNKDKIELLEKMLEMYKHTKDYDKFKTTKEEINRLKKESSDSNTTN